MSAAVKATCPRCSSWQRHAQRGPGTPGTFGTVVYLVCGKCAHGWRVEIPSSEAGEAPPVQQRADAEKRYESRARMISTLIAEMVTAYEEGDTDGVCELNAQICERVKLMGRAMLIDIQRGGGAL